MKESLHYVGLAFTFCSLIGAIYQYNDTPKRAPQPQLVQTDTLPLYNIKVYAVPADTAFGQAAGIKLYTERHLRELPLKFLKNYTTCAFTHIKDSVLTIGVKTSAKATKTDTFNIILPDSFPKKITLEMMHEFHKIEEGN